MSIRYLIRIETAEGNSITDSDAMDVLEHAWRNDATHPSVGFYRNAFELHDHVCAVEAGEDVFDPKAALAPMRHWFGSHMMCACFSCSGDATPPLGERVHHELARIGAVVKLYRTYADVCHDLEGEQVLAPHRELHCVAEQPVPDSTSFWIEDVLGELAEQYDCEQSKAA